MGYREIAAKQRGFLLHNQVTEEEYNEAVATGFIGIPPYEQDQELMKYVHYTELAEYSYIDAYYRDWLIAFPTIPPEKRHPPLLLPACEHYAFSASPQVGLWSLLV